MGNKRKREKTTIQSMLLEEGGLMIKFYPHQETELKETEEFNRVAYYHDMGLGKTFTGAEKLMRMRTTCNLVICQKSKIQDWIDHFNTYYDEFPYVIDTYNLTNGDAVLDLFIQNVKEAEKPNKIINDLTGISHEESSLDPRQIIGFINYELAFRRPELLQLKNFTLLLDESSLIQNETAKRTKFIMKLNFANLILLSGTPTGGKYEHLWSQLHLLGWNISKELFWKQYINFQYIDSQGFPVKVVTGYKNVERLKEKMREYGCRFLKTEEVFDLPEQIINNVEIEVSKEYLKFKKDRIITINNTELIGDTTLTKMLYERMLCGYYNSSKLDTLTDLLQSTEDRVIIFYNFNEEARLIVELCELINKPYSIVNGNGRELRNYDNVRNSVTLIQYQAGAMGLNLQKANKMIFFTPPLSSELFEQSKKRIHRIGQISSCFYYKLVVKNSIEEKIYQTLEMRKDYTDKLFEEEVNV